MPRLYGNAATTSSITSTVLNFPIPLRIFYYEPAYDLIEQDTQEEGEECSTYFAAKVNEAIDEILSGKKLPQFNTVEELFKDLKN